MDKKLFQRDGQNYKILLRNSQLKFPSENLSLEVVRCATFSQGYLNRQTILLFHCVGAPIGYFIRKQQIAKQICDLNFNLDRIKGKIGKIQKLYGNLFGPEEEKQQQKNARLNDLASDLKMTVEPCHSF